VGFGLYQNPRTGLFQLCAGDPSRGRAPKEPAFAQRNGWLEVDADRSHGRDEVRSADEVERSVVTDIDPNGHQTRHSKVEATAGLDAEGVT